MHNTCFDEKKVYNAATKKGEAFTSQTDSGIFLTDLAMRQENKRKVFLKTGQNKENIFAPLSYSQYRERLLQGNIRHLSPVSLTISAIQCQGTTPIDSQVAKLYGLREAQDYDALSRRDDNKALYGWGPTVTEFMRALRGMERDGGTQNFVMLVTEPGDGKTTFLDIIEEAATEYSLTHPLYRIKDCPNGDSASVLLHASERRVLREKGVYIDGQPCPHCQKIIADRSQNLDGIEIQPFALGNGVGTSGISPMWSINNGTTNMHYVFNTLAAANGGLVRMDEMANQSDVLLQLKDYLRGKKLDHDEGGKVFANVLLIAALTRDEFEKVFPKNNSVSSYSYNRRFADADSQATMLPLIQRSKLIFGRHNLQYEAEVEAINKITRLANSGDTHFSPTAKGILAYAIVRSRFDTSTLYSDKKPGDRYNYGAEIKLTPEQKFHLYNGTGHETVSANVLEMYIRERPESKDGRLGLSGGLVDSMVKEVLGQYEGECVDGFRALESLATFMTTQGEYISQTGDYHFMSSVDRAKVVFEQWIRETVIGAFVEEYDSMRKAEFLLYYNELTRLLDYESNYGANRPVVKLTI